MRHPPRDILHEIGQLGWWTLRHNGASLFMWPMTGSMAERRRSSRLMAPWTPRF